MSRKLKITIALLVVAVIFGGFSLPGLWRRVSRLARSQTSEEVSRREVLQPPVATPTDVLVKAQIYWASATAPDTLEPVEVELPLSANPAQRAKQVLDELIAHPPTPDQRTVPADVALLQFYLLPNGAAVADFSDTLATATPSGILSEQMVVDSITRTLAANVPGVQQLKILIHGQEAETLAGHVDLTGFFAVLPPAAPPAPAAPRATTGLATPPLTPSNPPVKLKP